MLTRFPASSAPTASWQHRFQLKSLNSEASQSAITYRTTHNGRHVGLHHSQSITARSGGIDLLFVYSSDNMHTVVLSLFT